MSTTPVSGKSGKGTGWPHFRRGWPVLRVKGMEEEGRAGVIDYPLTIYLGISHPLSIVVPHASLVASGVWLSECPDRLSGGRVDCDHGTAAAGHRVQQSVDIDRIRPKEVVDGWTEVIPPPDPCHLKIFEVVSVDLAQRRVPCMPGIPTDIPPLSLRITSILGSRRQNCTD